MLARPGGEVRAGILRVEQTMNPHLSLSGGPRVLRSLYSSSVVRGPLGAHQGVQRDGLLRNTLPIVLLHPSLNDLRPSDLEIRQIDHHIGSVLSAPYV